MRPTLIAAVMLAAALSACGSGGGETSSASTENSAFMPTAREDAAPFRTTNGDNSIQNYGSEDDRSDLEAASLVLHTYLDAHARGDWALACAQFSRSTRGQLAELASRARGNPRGCAATLATLLSGAPAGIARAEARAADVASLRAQGDRGFLLYRGMEAQAYAIPVQREGGRWKLGGLAAIPLGP